jgi:X-Pro dipeptidyl-peptidase
MAVLLALALTAAPAAAQEPSPPTWLKVENGQTQPQFAFDQAIEEVVFVETQLDSDDDGRLDRVRIRISRPRETQTLGYKVPVVFEHSPYRGDFGPAENHEVDFPFLPQESLFGREGSTATQLERAATRQRSGERSARTRLRGAAGPRADLPGQLDNYYVPRGYAVVLGESIGTFNSDGCPTVGDRVETLGTKAVIDWLNGRARGFDAAGPGGNPVSADWTTGAVGMVGVSYNGTLPNQVATTGVEGLETIVPISAISSWYDYYRANGLVRAPHSEVQGVGDNGFLGEDTDVLASFIGGSRLLGEDPRCPDTLPYLLANQDRVTGDYSPFWAARDYLDDVDDIEASVFVVHGLNDWNVMTKAFAEWWYRLDQYDVPRKIWLHNGGHGGQGPSGSPPALAYKATENRWMDHELFGVQNGIMSEPRSTLQREDGSLTTEADWPVPGTSDATLRLSAPNRVAPGTLSSAASVPADLIQDFVDEGRIFDTDDVLIQEPDKGRPNRLIYRSPALGSDVRISGTPWVELQMSIENRNAANLTAVLVDYGTAGSAPVMVTRGWLDPQNRNGISDSEPIRRGRYYDFRWDLQPDDYVFKAGGRIGLVVVSTDHDYTIRPNPGTRLTLRPSESSIELPVLNGQRALGF